MNTPDDELRKAIQPITDFVFLESNMEVGEKFTKLREMIEQLIHDREAKAEKRGFQKCLMEFDSTKGMREAERRGIIATENYYMLTGDETESHANERYAKIMQRYYDENNEKSDAAQSEQEGSDV